MPIYDFVCNDCQHQFTVRTSFLKKKDIVCPECNSTNLKEDYSGYGFFSSKSRQSNRRPFT